jgi:DNA (cytosine-5)-methyltransferase 1
MFTAAEHARIKGIPPDLIEGLFSTVAHETLGQSVIYAPFKGVGQHVGEALNRFKDGRISTTKKLDRQSDDEAAPAKKARQNVCG